MGSAAGSQLGPGTTVGGYRVEALIGRGGMGAVYRAVEEGLERQVALKVIAPELASDERFRERFLRESKIAASLDHPHVVPIYQAGEEDGVLFLAMRYVEGTDLARVIAEEGALDPGRACAFLSEVAEALDAAHEKGLVHRDVKPSNVLIAVAGGREHCYLSDFGLTKRSGSLSGLTTPGEIVGTLEYVAPEQITGDALDERADVYSLGCVLYETLTGQSPFPRATDVALLWAHVHEEPTPPSEAREGLPKELDTVFARALAKEPGRRYRSTGELVAATRSALRLVETPPAPRTRSRLLLAGAAALLALVGVAVAAALVVRDRDAGGLSTVSPNAVGVIDPSSNALVDEIPVGIAPESIAVGDGAVWVANVDDETVTRIDARSRQVVRTIALPESPERRDRRRRQRVGGARSPAEVARIDTAQNEPGPSPIAAFGEESSCASRPGRASPSAVGRCGTRVPFRCSVGSTHGRTAAVAVPLGGDLLLSASSTPPEFADIAFALGSPWIVLRATNAIAELDPSIGRALRQVTVGAGPVAIGADAGGLWVANFDDDSVTRVAIDDQGGSPSATTIPVGDGPTDVAVGGGGVWVANALDRTVMRIDPESGEVVATISVGNEPQRLAADESGVWVTVQAPATTPESD